MKFVVAFMTVANFAIPFHVAAQFTVPDQTTPSTFPNNPAPQTPVPPRLEMEKAFNR